VEGPVQIFCGQGGVLQMWTSALFGAKNFKFFENYGVLTWTRREMVEPVQTCCEQGGRWSHILCWHVFYGQPLSTFLRFGKVYEFFELAFFHFLFQEMICISQTTIVIEISLSLLQKQLRLFLLLTIMCVKCLLYWCW